MKPKNKIWNLTLDHGDFTTNTTIEASVVKRVPNSNTVIADEVIIRCGGNVVSLEVAK